MAETPDRRGFSLTGLLLRDRVAILAALLGVTALSWLYLWSLANRGMGAEMTAASGMGDMAGMAMSAGPRPWTGADFGLMFAMWWVMMVGMMLPSAAPMLLTFATVNQRQRVRHQPFVPTAVFASGYLAAWGGFSLAATVAEWSLEQASLMSPTIATTSPIPTAC